MPAALPIALADDGLAELVEADVAIAVLVEQPHPDNTYGIKYFIQ